MNFTSVLSCLSLLLAAAVAQAPQPCVSPGQMVGDFSLLAADGFIMASGSMNYNSFAERMRVRSYGYAGNGSYEIDQLLLFKENVYYEIDWHRYSCTKRPLNTEFNLMRVPEDAELIGQIYMGSSSSWGMGVLVNNWTGRLAGNGTYFTVYSEIGCIPMTMAAYMPGAGWTTVSTYNWVVGDTDPMDFIPHRMCARAKLEENETPVSVFGALESLARKTKKEV